VTTISILGAGAFGTALAIAFARDDVPVFLWGRDAYQVDKIATTRLNSVHLAGARIPVSVSVTADLSQALQSDIIILAIPMQQLGGFLNTLSPDITGKTVVSCAKGIDLATGEGAVSVIDRHLPDVSSAILSGPGFAVDIASGVPTALTIASRDTTCLTALQKTLSTPKLRLYRTTDVTGVELGGAIKNIIAIACGIAIGHGFSESTRAALVARGFAEMRRYAQSLGALDSTLIGLSGLGDLVLTCTSEKSRNYSFGLQVGSKGDITVRGTVEGVATTKAIVRKSGGMKIDLPIAATLNRIFQGQISVAEAVDSLLSRPLISE
jgi:glycerol-3-phosphate dehydrogenase (NAD(P)+)